MFESSLPWNVPRATVPLSALAEIVLGPVLELALYVVGYGTGRILIWIASLGRATVEVADRKSVRPRWHELGRSEDGRVIVEADMAACLGLMFWLFVAAVAIGISCVRAGPLETSAHQTPAESSLENDR